MIYGNSKNTTFTQSTTNCNSAVGFFLALIFRILEFGVKITPQLDGVI